MYYSRRRGDRSEIALTACHCGPVQPYSRWDVHRIRYGGGSQTVSSRPVRSRRSAAMAYDRPGLVVSASDAPLDRGDSCLHRLLEHLSRPIGCNSIARLPFRMRTELFPICMRSALQTVTPRHT